MSADTTVNVMTPYGFSNELNKLLKEKGIEKTIRPQMMYNYRKNNLLKKPLTKEYAIEWVEKYVKRNELTAK
jgi:hypothetical protein